MCGLSPRRFNPPFGVSAFLCLLVLSDLGANPLPVFPRAHPLWVVVRGQREDRGQAPEALLPLPLTCPLPRQSSQALSQQSVCLNPCPPLPYFSLRPYQLSLPHSKAPPLMEFGHVPRLCCRAKAGPCPLGIPVC